MENPKGSGGCFRNALVAAGFNCTKLDIPEWVLDKKRQEIYQELGLRSVPAGTVDLDDDRRYIVIVASVPGRGHAQLMFGSSVPSKVLELVPLPYEWELRPGHTTIEV